MRSDDVDAENASPKAGFCATLCENSKRDFVSYLNEYVTYCGGNLDSCLDSDNQLPTQRQKMLTAVSEKDVVVFAKPGCGFCKRAKDQLAELQQQQSFDIAVLDVIKGTAAGNALASILVESLQIGDLTFPQIVVRGKYIGGADDLAEHVDAGRWPGILASDKETYDVNASARVSWEASTLAGASKPQLLQVPRVRGEGAWFPHWPWYSFQWCMWANLVRYISWVQLALMVSALALYKTGVAANAGIADILVWVLLADCAGLVLLGPSPWTLSGILSTYFGWRVRGNAVNAVPYKVVWTAYLAALIPLSLNGSQSSKEVALAAGITNSALLAVLRF